MFKIKILRHHWIQDDNEDDKEDLCSHGTMFIQINDEILSDENADSWCTTAAVLHLMRSAINSYAPGDFCGQLIPCCGHFMVIDPKKDELCIMGCNNGIDFSITHEGDSVVSTTATENSCRILKAEFQQKILDLALDVEQFYGLVENKIAPSDPDDAKAFRRFWEEWESLKTDLQG